MILTLFYNSCPYFILPGTTDKYTFAQLHVHLSSEHTIDGKYYAAELHMVHVGPKRYSVVGTMIMPNKPDDNQAFGPYIDSWKDARFAMESTCPADTSCKVKNKYTTGNNLLYPGANKMKPYNLVETGRSFRERERSRERLDEETKHLKIMVDSILTLTASTLATAYTVGALSFSAAMAAGQFLLEYFKSS